MFNQSKYLKPTYVGDWDNGAEVFHKKCDQIWRKYDIFKN